MASAVYPTRQPSTTLKSVIVLCSWPNAGRPTNTTLSSRSSSTVPSTVSTRALPRWAKRNGANAPAASRGKKKGQIKAEMQSVLRLIDKADGVTEPFRPDAEANPGRANVYTLGERVVAADDHVAARNRLVPLMGKRGAVARTALRAMLVVVAHVSLFPARRWQSFTIL